MLWAQVFIVLPAVHLQSHGHHADAHHADAHYADAHHADAHHAEPHPDHDAHSAAHLGAAVLPIAPTLLSLFHRIPAERPLRSAPATLDQARAGHGWTPRGPPI